MTIARRLLFLLLAAAAAFSAAPLLAQAPQAVTVYGPVTRDLGSLMTLTGQTAATINSADQSGFNITRVVCVYQQSSRLNTPSTTFKIQNKDAASGTYYDVITSSAVTTSTTPNPIAAGGGVTTTANVGAGVPIAAKWRVSATVAGTTPIVTATIGCSVQ